ncbi:MAG: hypothetical protein H8D45_27185 [Bacteroidetes bacterium]|nr:hypothetical protein [Bacteroidota bacterium]MBL7105793.1 hypothetical protein [Bacteroidales bacterium]
MENTYFNKTINKYAILLSIFYLGKVLLAHFPILNGTLLVPYFFVTNIIIALIVNSDLKKNEIKSALTVWSCVFFDILGVALLLIQIIRKEKTASAL